MPLNVKAAKAAWFTFGLLFPGIAYVGVIVSGISWSTPGLIADYRFSRSSERFHGYMLPMGGIRAVFLNGGIFRRLSGASDRPFYVNCPRLAWPFLPCMATVA